MAEGDNKSANMLVSINVISPPSGFTQRLRSAEGALGTVDVSISC